MASIGGAAESKSTADPNTGKFPTSEEIQSRAYQIYMERGGADGNDLEDWLQAEQELRQSATSGE
ncbi:MAG TPA: DUF2934 domain-containing protein [Candidatus Acidoferrum sp.]|jgi:hypothetical protein|nr:DUF2934 domain-containing protein [Candidatus Acidoferrum sp.]